MTAGPARICVCVSGEGSNLRALRAAERRGLLGGTVTNVIADRPCKAVEWAAADGIETKVVAPSSFADRTAWDEGLAGAISAARPDLVVLAGFMRVVGRSVLDIAPRRILNVHPSLLPSFPGTDAVGDALAAGVRVTGVTVHIVDSTLDGGPIVLQEPVAVMSDDDRDTLHARLHAVEHRLLPRAVALMLAGAARMAERGVDIDASRAAELPVARRALLSVSDKTGIVELGTSLVELGFELLSTGGTARALRLANIPVTDVSTVTGVPEMLDGRVKTLHPQIAGALLADLRSTAHREQLAAAAIDPIELVVVNLYPFEAASRRPDITADELVEEIDIGGPTLVRAAAKNHANVTVVTDPADYDTVVKALRSPAGIGDGMRRDLAVRAFAHTATYDSTIARKLPHVLGRLAPVTEDLSPERVQLSLERVEELRYGENPHQRAALYRSLDASADEGPFANGAHLLQGKPLSYNNILDAARATALCRDLRGAAVVIVKH
nr:phosphoribosylglycinamide formyltransferase [Chloroflexota bacterium]